MTRLLQFLSTGTLVISVTSTLFGASVDLSPPRNSMGYADENGYFRMIQRFGEIEFSNGLEIPIRFDFWTGRAPLERVSEFGWHGWRCGLLESRATAYGGDRFMRVDLLCAKTLFLEKVSDSEGQFISPDRSWLGLLEEGRFTISRADGWKLVYEDELISYMRTDDGIEINWVRDADGKLTSIEEVGVEEPTLTVNWTQDDAEGAVVSEIVTADAKSKFGFAYERPAHLRFSMDISFAETDAEGGSIAFSHKGNQMEIESGDGLRRQFQWNPDTGWITSDGVNRYEIERDEENLVTVLIESATGETTSRVVNADEVILQDTKGVSWKTRYSVDPGLSYRKVVSIERKEGEVWVPVVVNHLGEQGQVVARDVYAEFERFAHYSEGRVERVLLPGSGMSPKQLFYVREFREEPYQISFVYDEQQRHLKTLKDDEVVFERAYHANGKVASVEVEGRYSRTTEFNDDGGYSTRLDVTGLSQDNWPKFYSDDDSLVPEMQIAGTYTADGLLQEETLLDGTSYRYEYDGDILSSKKHVAVDGETLISQLTYLPQPDGRLVVKDERFLERKTRQFLLTMDESGKIIQSTPLSDFRLNQILNHEI